jgi:hypothetical protein
MPIAVPTELPEATLLAQLRRSGCYTDCFTLTLPMVATQAQFIEAFYTTRLFKMERLVLRVLAGSVSTDAQAADLANGSGSAFAVWQVNMRTAGELLLTDETGRTSSWLMAVPDHSSGESGTRLFFGSAIKPRRASVVDGQAQFGPLFHGLLGLHNLYSRRLLEAAAKRLGTNAAQRASGDA